MEKRERSSTSALLQRVSTQLKGERVPTVTKEEDELTEYLNSLTKKTAQQTKAVNFNDFGDISISSSDNISTPKQKSPKLGAGSKFLKKKIIDRPQPVEPVNEPNSWKKSPAARNTSAVLNKSADLTNKIKTQTSLLANQNVFSIDTDTEDSESRKVARVSHPETPSDLSVGHDGRRFMKRPETPKAMKDDRKPKQTQDNSSEKSKSFKKGKKKNLHNILLTSEEESLADFMQRLSSSESTPRPHSAKYHQRPADGAPPKTRSPSPESKPYRFTPSPRSPRKSPLIGRQTPSPLAMHSRSQDSDMVESIVSEVVDTPETASSDDMFKVVMDIDALEPAMPEIAEKPRKSKSTEKRSEDKIRKPSKEKKTKESDIFSTFGLHSIEDLMGRISDDDNESIASEISEIQIERHGSSTQLPRIESLTNIKTFGSGITSRKHVSLSQNSNFEDSISERIGIISKRDKSSIMSEVRTQYSGEDTVGEYTEGFDSETESITESYLERRHKPSSKSKKHVDREKSFSESYTSYSDSKTYSKSYPSSKILSSPPKHSPSKRSVQVQTGEEPGLSYSWKTPMATIGPSYGLNFVDPSPIATHVVSADALEAMTAFSPAMIALHDMLKQQLILTQSFLSAQERIYKNFSTSLESNYHYTTLEDTKEYIKKHRKAPISFKQALKLVSAEMD